MLLKSHALDKRHLQREKPSFLLHFQPQVGTLVSNGWLLYQRTSAFWWLNTMHIFFTFMQLSNAHSWIRFLYLVPPNPTALESSADNRGEQKSHVVRIHIPGPKVVYLHSTSQNTIQQEGLGMYSHWGPKGKEKWISVITQLYMSQRGKKMSPKRQLASFEGPDPKIGWLKNEIMQKRSVTLAQATRMRYTNLRLMWERTSHKLGARHLRREMYVYITCARKALRGNQLVLPHRCMLVRTTRLIVSQTARAQSTRPLTSQMGKQWCPER